MSVTISEKLVIAISSRALFDLSESHRIFEEEGIDAYLKYQIAHENDVLNAGAAFHLVKKLLAILHPETKERLVEVILLSRNSADTGLRIFNSIQHHQLPITRAAFTNGESPYRYVNAFEADLFLSTHPDDVARALSSQCAAATLFPSEAKQQDITQVRIAFDGDAVLFSDEAEQVFQSHGLDAFRESESKAAHKPLQAGPFAGFLKALQQIQNLFPTDNCPIRTALVTARDAPAHERVINTLRAWEIRIDEALFLGGLSKAEFLKAFEADIFFDDQKGHCHDAAEHVATGHVPHGIVNTKP
ncbi:MAG: 5'-nucleotidase [Legionellales bacterium]|nr:5'-nucleotidase [Legionellales bacterium]